MIGMVMRPGFLGAVLFFTAAAALADDSMFIDSRGFLGIGNDNPERQFHMKGPNAVFRMDRPSNSAAFLMVRTNATGAPLKTFVLGTNASGSDNGEFIINDLGARVSGGGARRMTIRNDGEVDFTGAVNAPGFITNSSRKLKAAIAPITAALAIVHELEGVQFEWKATGEPTIGLIAEDVAEVLPAVVQHDPEDGQATGVNYPALVALLIEALKEQQVQVVQNQARAERFRAEAEANEQELAALTERVEAIAAETKVLAALLKQAGEAGSEGELVAEVTDAAAQ